MAGRFFGTAAFGLPPRQVPSALSGRTDQYSHARYVAFLASDDAGLITGSTLTANRGQCFA